MNVTQIQEKQALQEQEYYLPYHWLMRKGSKEVQMRKLELVARMAGQALRSGGRALDLGCGDGKHTSELQRIFQGRLQFTGVDFSERAITYARMLAPHIRFDVQDAKQAGFPDASFDLVVSIEVIEHIPIPEVPAFLLEIRRLLKPGGVVVLTTPTPNRPLDEKHFQHFDENIMRGYLTDAGFEVREVAGFGQTLPPWLDKVYRYFIDLPACWRFQKMVQGKILPVAKANCIVVSAVKP